MISICIVTLIFVTSTHLLFIKPGSGTYEKYKGKDFFSNELIISTGTLQVYESTYLTLKRIALNTAQQHFLFGVGPGMFNDEVDEYKKQGRIPSTIQSYDPHSTYFGALAETGILGLLTLLAFLLAVYAKLISIARMKYDSQYLLFFILFTCFLIEAIATDIMNFRHFWVMLAVIFAYSFADNFVRAK